MSNVKKIVPLLITLFLFLLIIRMLKDIWQLQKAGERVKATADKLAKVIKENAKLKEKEKYYQSEEFQEEQIRDKLQLAKPGEMVVILPEQYQQTSESTESTIFQDNTQEPQSNWQKWLKLFW